MKSKEELASAKPTWWHQHAVGEFSAATLSINSERGIPMAVARSSEMQAGEEAITYREWLHSRLLSRAGLLEDGAAGPSSSGADVLHRRAQLFKLTLGCGGT